VAPVMGFRLAFAGTRRNRVVLITGDSRGRGDRQRQQLRCPAPAPRRPRHDGRARTGRRTHRAHQHVPYTGTPLSSPRANAVFSCPSP